MDSRQCENEFLQFCKQIQITYLNPLTNANSINISYNSFHFDDSTDSSPKQSIHRNKQD